MDFFIHSVEKSVNTISNFDEYDLIVDSTGQVEIAEYLNEKIIQIPAHDRPHLLHLWIYGNGECVQALMNTPSDYESKGGCISCLHQSGIQDYKDDLDPLGNKDYKKSYGLGTLRCIYSLFSFIQSICGGFSNRSSFRMEKF